MAVRTVLQLSPQVESILNGVYLKVVLLKFFHVMDGLFMWVYLAPTFCSYSISLIQWLLFQLGVLHDS
jgi:hypothetical protein